MTSSSSSKFLHTMPIQRRETDLLCLICKAWTSWLASIVQFAVQHIKAKNAHIRNGNLDFNRLHQRITIRMAICQAIMVSICHQSDAGVAIGVTIILLLLLFFRLFGVVSRFLFLALQTIHPVKRENISLFIEQKSI